MGIARVGCSALRAVSRPHGGTQIGMQEFTSRSLRSFAYRMTASGLNRAEQAGIVEDADPAARAHGSATHASCGSYRAIGWIVLIDAFANSDIAHQRIGRPENEGHKPGSLDQGACYADAAGMRLYRVGERVSLGKAHGQPLSGTAGAGVDDHFLLA